MTNIKNIENTSDDMLQLQIDEAYRKLSEMSEGVRSSFKGDWLKDCIDELEAEKNRRFLTGGGPK